MTSMVNVKPLLHRLTFVTQYGDPVIWVKVMKLSFPLIVTIGLFSTTSKLTVPVIAKLSVAVVVIMVLFSTFTNVMFVAAISLTVNDKTINKVYKNYKNILNLLQCFLSSKMKMEPTDYSH